MYLARFDTNAEEWIQAVALIDTASARPPTLASAYWDEVACHLSAATRIPRGTVVRRITVDQRHRLRQTVSVIAPAEYERRIREIFARLTRIERMPGGSVSLAQNWKERDEWLGDVGPLRFRATSESFSVHGVPLAYNFRMAPILDDLLIDACLVGYKLTYQIHMRATEVEPEWLRAARKNVLALHAVPGARQALIDWQEGLACALGYASALCEEYLVVDAPAGVESVASLLADRFHTQYGPMGFSPPAFRFEQRAHEDSLVIGVHSHDIDPLSPIDLCSVATAAAERDRLLAWRPSSRLLGLLAPDPGGGAEPERADPSPPPGPDDGSLPEPYVGEGPFAFASYKREDLYRIAPIINLVREYGMPVWYDHGIPGGAEWDEVIEDRLENCRFVLLFTSQAAIDSKYVRREVKFADTRGVQVLPIKLEDAALAHGMDMLLTQYQTIDTRAADFPSQLRRAVAYLRGGTKV